jgi:starch-binding outer membrane protein, SusD/RagB family
MKINKFIYVFSTFALLFCNTGCENILDQKSESEIEEVNFWKTNADAESGVVSMYDAMQKTYGNGGGSKFLVWGELRSDNYKNSVNAGADQVGYVTQNIANTNAAALRWDQLYRTIALSNLAIARIPKITGFNPTFLGEARMGRAMAYFDAVRIWGAVPMVTQPIEGISQELKQPRTEAEKIMNEIIIPDMLEAEKLITTAPTATNSFRFNKAAVLAFQADVYMFLKKYAEAKAAFTKLENLKAFTLTNTRKLWNDQFTNDNILANGVTTQTKIQISTEYIFTIKYNKIEDGDRSAIYANLFAGLPGFYINDSLERKWVANFPLDSASWYKQFGSAPLQVDALNKPVYGDYRYFECREALAGPGFSRVAKYNKININPNVDDTDLIFYRYSGILLQFAEAENQLGNLDAAITLLNRVRTARQLPAAKKANITSKEQMENILLDERQFELLGEGKRWWDLLRTGKAEALLASKGRDKRYLLWPIWRTHRVDNPLLTQNDGY